MEWMLLALAAAVVLAVQVEANRHFNCDGLRLNFWRAIFTSALFLPLSFFVEWPSDPLIYALAVLNGVGGVFTCALLFNLAARRQSRVSSLYSPLATLTSLLLWVAISSDEQQRILMHPLAGLMVVFALGLAAVGLSRFRANDISWGAFIAVLPVGLFYGLTDVLSRVVLSGYDMIPVIIVFGFVTSLINVAVNAAALSYKRLPHSADKQLLRAAGALALTSLMFMLTLTPALLLAPSPAYPGFFLMTMPVMLLVYHRINHVSDDADWRAALLIVAGAVIASLQGIWFV